MRHLCPPLLLVAVLSASAVACRTAAPQEKPTGDAEGAAAEGKARDDGSQAPLSEGASTLGSGDVLEVRVFQEPDLTGAYRVSPEGVINFPLCGRVSLSGKTSTEAAEALTQCLAAGYIKRPQVSVLVREYSSKKVFVFGEVQKPGTFPYEENMSVVQAVTLAGGFTKTAAKNSTNVTRIVEGQEMKIRVPVADIGVGREKNFTLQPGDIVFVPESFF